MAWWERIGRATEGTAARGERRRSVYEDRFADTGEEPEPDWQPLETFRAFHSGIVVDADSGVIIEDYRPRDRWGRPRWPS
jgi:hypothetical protein